jgi:hypothetical protein
MKVRKKSGEGVLKFKNTARNEQINNKYVIAMGFFVVKMCLLRCIN